MVERCWKLCNWVAMLKLCGSGFTVLSPIKSSSSVAMAHCPDASSTVCMVLKVTVLACTGVCNKVSSLDGLKGLVAEFSTKSRWKTQSTWHDNSNMRSMLVMMDNVDDDACWENDLGVGESANGLIVTCDNSSDDDVRTCPNKPAFPDKKFAQEWHCAETHLACILPFVAYEAWAHLNAAHRTLAKLGTVGTWDGSSCKLCH